MISHPIITITSDWGTSDHYASALKGMILGKLENANIVDITHNIPPFDIKKAAFVVCHSFRNFPVGSVHIICVNSEESQETPHVAIKYRGHYFIGADNGIFSLIFRDQPEEVVEIDIPQDSGLYTFPERDRFAKAAVELALGNPLASLGFVRDEVNSKLALEPQFSDNSIRATVIYIDNYDNAFLNVTSEQFYAAGGKVPFELNIKGKGRTVKQISTAYSDVPEGEIVVLFGSTGLMEVAINKSRAASLLGIRNDDQIIIEFGK